MREVLTIGFGKDIFPFLTPKEISFAQRFSSNSFFLTFLKYWDGVEKSGLFSGDKKEQLGRIGSFFNEEFGGVYRPRTLFVDLETQTIDNIKSGDLGRLFDPTSFVCGTGGTGNNWGVGHYTNGNDYLSLVLDGIRIELEQCDSVHAFQILHSCEGGTGSGLGTLTISHLREMYPDVMMVSASGFPSPEPHVPDIMTAPYNATLSVHQLVENVDICLCFDNKALYKLCENKMKIVSPSFDELNSIVSKVLRGMTASIRFPGLVNGDLRKLGVNLVPFPRLHFFMPGYSPLCDHKDNTQYTVSKLIEEIYNPNNMMCSVNPAWGRYITCATLFRGRELSMEEVERQSFKKKHELLLRNNLRIPKNVDAVPFCDWIYNNVYSTVCCNVPPQQKSNSSISSTFLGNSTAIQQLFKRISEQFIVMFRRKAFLHPYIHIAGMDEMEFTEAESNMNDLISEWQWGMDMRRHDYDEEELFGEDEDMGEISGDELE